MRPQKRVTWNLRRDSLKVFTLDPKPWSSRCIQ